VTTAAFRLPVAQPAVPVDGVGAALLPLLAAGELDVAACDGVAAALDEDGELAAVAPLLDAQAAASTAVPSRMVAMPVRRATWAEGVMVG
jgi:hypothetical protein